MARLDPKDKRGFELGLVEMVKQNISHGSTEELERGKVAAVLEDHNCDGGLNHNFSGDPAVTILLRE